MTDRECVALLQWALPRLGLRWAGFRRVRGQVCKRIARRIAALRLADAAAYRARLDADASEWAVLDTFCWISISRFFRDHGVFDALTRDLLPELARAARAEGRRVLSAWCAGCASGEEPYSLALAFAFGAAQENADTELQIVATDASSALLDRARRGVYPPSALDELPPGWRDAAFEPIDGAFRLRDRFRSSVAFERQDLREAMPPGPFDLILCRNLAFTYFSEDVQRDVLTGLAARLAPGGALLVGAHEVLPEPAAALVRSAAAPGLYRRSAGVPAARSGTEIAGGSTARR